MKLGIVNFWYQKHYLRWFLLPFSWVYSSICCLRRLLLKKFLQKNFPVPVIVVGNITVGGAGKTPLVIAIAEKFRARGLKVGIVSRGYGALVRQFPHEISQDDSASLVGDEPLLLARKTGCPVVIAPKRVAAINYLLKHHQSEVIISDDGLQHYTMGRAVEIVVIDGRRGLGNGLCLPAGPLRESAKRLKTADFIIANQGSWPQAYQMELKAGNFINLRTGQEILASEFKEEAAAIAGIGNPERFFYTLSRQGLKFTPYIFNDHHPFQENELKFPEKWIVMTEKDAVKCHAFAKDNMYYLPVKAYLCDEFWTALWSHKKITGLVTT
ncbi:tetraacyldisaccharide 4'-kinase [Legionella londiniensis]|uniref:Tetraacyldisaccharide 4'-kinase n=1 Tax=Legionella londiniensis TaxID=45068 RepID=A0A0W0VSD5_9GAMM|nr:tetraacyldisaccharide 4'-kinase [Legionella londiniensis]KTD22933.1 tetraacyldisaccharide 4'-kinase [Legionella londiniensis]STX92959.1 tetraacyldisaccharide 4'-kinase [Legionella londiniensis]